MTGSIEVISGGMFSGKSEELMRRIRRAKIAKQKVQIFKHSLDKRYDANHIHSHDKRGDEAVPASDSNEIMKSIQRDTTVVAIDEAQFFDDGLASVCETLANNGKRVIVAGLDLDSWNRPFGPMPKLLALAETVDKLRAVCVKCGNNASRSFMKTLSENVINPGAADKYEARCRTCHNSGT
jgi:thymidine kinase